jgi:hypothetical protein
MEPTCKAIDYASHNFFESKKDNKKRVTQLVRLKIEFAKSEMKKINLTNELPGLTMP